MIMKLLMVSVCVAVASAHRYGADLQACDTMKPGHGTTRRQTRATPFIIETHQPGYVPCTTLPLNNQFPNCGVIVRIRTRRSGNFKGFLLQARSKMPDGSVMYVGDFRYSNGQMIQSRAGNRVMQGGNFNNNPIALGQVAPDFNGPVALGQVAPDSDGPVALGQVAPDSDGPVALGQVAPGFGNQFGNNRMGGNQFGNQFGGQFQRQTTNVVVQKLQCARGFGVTHTENSLKNYVQLIWYPPVGFNRPVQFVATVVQDFNTYWMGHRSSTLRARPRLTMSRTSAQTGRWFNRYNSAPKTTFSLGIVITSVVSVLFYFL